MKRGSVSKAQAQKAASLGRLKHFWAWFLKPEFASGPKYDLFSNKHSILDWNESLNAGLPNSN